MTTRRRTQIQVGVLELTCGAQELESSARIHKSIIQIISSKLKTIRAPASKGESLLNEQLSILRLLSPVLTFRCE